MYSLAYKFNALNNTYDVGLTYTFENTEQKMIFVSLRDTTKVSEFLPALKTAFDKLNAVIR